MQLIIDTANTRVSVRNKCFFIENKKVKRQISPTRLSSISITVNCDISTAAIKLAAQRQIPILFFNNFGTVQARMYSPYFTNLASLRKKQYLFSQSPVASRWLIDLLVIKSKEQIRNLKLAYKRKGGTPREGKESIASISKMIVQIGKREAAPISKLRSSILGWEGTIGRIYFSTLKSLVPDPFKFESRSRRPALDYFNAALNYIYGMTYGLIESGVFAKGLDPGIGILHVDAYQKPTLVYDLIEPFRPVMDRVLLKLIWEGKLSSSHFIEKEQGFWMNKSGKRIIIRSFSDFIHQRILYRDKVLRLKDHIYKESYKLADLIDETITLL